ncbi:MAG: hypothetical protein HEP71_09285 [Roseivirga sp.]|nr:hypothetical protein [Roseivirga sp.]
MRTDIAGLRAVIKLEYHPNDLKWEVRPIGEVSSFGPTEYILMASFSLKGNELEKLKTQYLESEDIGSEVALRKQFIGGWFLNSIKSFSIEKQEQGAYKVKSMVYEATGFFKSPFIDGICFFKEESIYLLLNTK